MRNLKKVLALALANVMMLGMMTIASAKEYVDDNAINDKYDVAIDIMYAIGAIEGTPDGKFNPTAGLTRAQAAAIATRVALTRETADHVTAVADPFTDVAMGNWAAGYIVAAKNLGLVDGLGDGTFAPTGVLKGYEFAKMLLCVLGYSASAEGYVGSAWEYNVNKDARAAGLLAGLDNLKLNQPITREEAAQMAFNALFADMVKYEGGSSMVVNGVVIEQKGKLEVTGETLAVDVYEIVEGEKTDEFGYSFKTWSIEDEEIAAADNFTVKASFPNAAALTEGALYTALGKATAKVEIAVYVNGVDTDLVEISKDDFNALKDGEEILFPEYTGDFMELIEKGGAYKLMVAEAQIAEVTDVTEAEGETERAVTVTFLDGSTKTYTTDNFSMGEKLKVYVKNDAVIAAVTITMDEMVFGSVTRTETEPAAIYVGDTRYPLAYGVEIAPSATKYCFYLDNGYVIAAEEYVEEDVADKLADYVYVMKQAEEPMDKAETDFGAAASGEADAWETQVVYMDGTVAVVKASAEVTEGKIYKMTEEDGLKVFTEAAKVAFDGEGKVTNTTDFFFVAANVAGYDFEDKYSTFGTEKLYVTADTKVLTIELQMDNQTVPQPTGFAKAAVVSAPAAEGTLESTIGAVYAWNANAKVRELVMVITVADVTTEAEDLYYVNDTVLGTEYDAAAKKIYKTIRVYEIATGIKSTVKVAADFNEIVTGSGYYYGEVKNGVYAFEAADMSEADTYTTVAKKDITTYGGMLFVKDRFGDYEYADTKVVDIKGGTVDTIDKLVAKSAEKAAITFDKFTHGEVDYIVVTNY